MFQNRLVALVLAIAVTAAAVVCPSRCAAVNIVLDYSRDGNGFFPVGSQARAAMQATATFYSNLLTDSLSAIAEPADFHSSVFDGVATWDGILAFPKFNPTGVENFELANQTILANEYRIYVGAQNFDASTLGIGGPGGYAVRPIYKGSFTAAEANQVVQIDDAFKNTAKHRGQSSGFAAWGGAITFNNSAATVWHFNHTIAPPAGANDFYSVAIHEMAHALGFGASDEWTNFATGATFTGPAAAAVYGSQPPLENPNPTRGHWLPGTMSKILGTNTMQEAAMDPEITQGTRKLLTALDAAALKDIGWSTSTPTYNAADFNHDGTVNAPDLGIWKTAFKTTAAADADADGDSDGNDLLMWQRRLGLGAAVAAGAGVPEPGGIALVVGAGPYLIAVLRRRRYAASSGRIWVA